VVAERAWPKLLVIVGPTASGKSELALRVARRLEGEIIAADSRTIYKGLDIGTAKPTANERLGVPHWGIDLIEPGQSLTAADFKRYAEQKIEQIKKRGHLPILVGGTGLYVDSVLFDFRFGAMADPAKRAELEKLEVSDLQAILVSEGVEIPTNRLNKRHLIRAIERAGEAPSKNDEPRPDALIIGLWPPTEVLQKRINQRAEKIFSSGVIEETRDILDEYPDVPLSNLGIVYRLCSGVLQGVLTKQEAIQQFKQRDWQYARRQRTWFKRNPCIKWFEDINSAEKYLVSLLNT
jgi:tRNA dimethylallyltransferase